MINQELFEEELGTCDYCDREIPSDELIVIDNTPPLGFNICSDCYDELTELVKEEVVKLYHEDFFGGYDVWWRRDYEEFIKDYPEAEQDFEIETFASLEDAISYIEMRKGYFNVWPKGLIRNRYEEASKCK